MTALVNGAGLIGSQVARILVERGEKPVLMDFAAQPQAISQIVDLAQGELVAGDVLRPLSIVDALGSHGITKIAHTAANPLLTLGAEALLGDQPQHHGHGERAGGCAGDRPQVCCGVIIERAQPLLGGRRR